MATFNAQTPTDPDRPLGGRAGARAGLSRDGGSVRTIYYVTSAGAFGNTTDPAAVPSGAGIVRTVNS